MANQKTLAGYLKANEISASDFARRIKARGAKYPPHGAISRLLNGKADVGADLALRIFKETSGNVVLDRRLLPPKMAKR